MAGTGDTQNDFKAHVKSYNNFAWLMKWGTIISAIVTALVVIMIS